MGGAYQEVGGILEEEKEGTQEQKKPPGLIAMGSGVSSMSSIATTELLPSLMDKVQHELPSMYTYAITLFCSRWVVLMSN